MITHSKPWITDEDRAAAEAPLRTGMLAQGKLVAELEARIAEFHGAAGGVAVASGTAALILALRALELRPGSEIILPTYVCASVAEAVAVAGATPVLCDVGEDWNMDERSVAAQVTPRTGAIILVHLFGTAADISRFRRFGVPIVEDCAQALGARCGGAFAGSAGMLSIFSFHATKCLATGEGGMALSGDSRLVAAMRRLRDGDPSRFDSRVASPMTEVQAALGLSQWRRYASFLEARRACAQLYFTMLPASVTAKLSKLAADSMFFRFPVFDETLNPDAAIAWFRRRNIAVRKGVDELLHRRLGLPDAEYPSAVRHYSHTLSLPIYPSLSAEQRSAVIAAVGDWHDQR